MGKQLVRDVMSSTLVTVGSMTPWSTPARRWPTTVSGM
jgi:hypothetical protein